MNAKDRLVPFGIISVGQLVNLEEGDWVDVPDWDNRVKPTKW
jgi:hypothetical protein